MRHYRSYIEGPAKPGGRVALDEDERRHLVSVRRVETGEDVILVNGAGQEWSGRVASIDKRRVQVDVLELLRDEVPPPRRVVLAPALTRGEAFDDLIARAVEVGATELRPLLTERVVVKWPRDREPEKLARWRRLTVEALKQCERLHLPRVHAPVTLVEVLEAFRAEDIIHIALVERRPKLAPLHTLAAELEECAVAVLTGPEGGWTDEEAALLESSGARLAGLPTPAVLRAETAALVALGMVVLR